MMYKHSHRRFNPLTGRWILVSPHRSQRPWQGKIEDSHQPKREQYDPECYLCPGNVRANGEHNPEYKTTYTFVNDFSALTADADSIAPENTGSLLTAKPERGLCKVICFSPRHDLTLAELNLEELEQVLATWKHEYHTIGAIDYINYVTIFENKGQLMGCSNPHPHGQIWAQESLPEEAALEQKFQSEYFLKHNSTLLADYVQQELASGERLIAENEHFVLLVPFWAIWPFETMILPKKAIQHIGMFTKDQTTAFAEILSINTIKYDNLFQVSFPYSAGIHQAPTDGREHPEWHMHMHFYPPLLRSAEIKKFMVGYEMIAEPQRDITPEKSAEILRNLDTIHYSVKGV